MADSASRTIRKPLRVLVVEDEALIGMMFEDALQDLGCEVVGICTTLDRAKACAASLEFDVAILDVNIHGQEITPVGHILRSRGIPFVVSTGYRGDSIPDEFRERPLLAKPFGDEDIKTALQAVIAGLWTFGQPEHVARRA